MYNIKAAVSRLNFAPDTDEMKVTDIATGHFVFSPVPNRAISYDELEQAIEGAGYKIESAAIEAVGTFEQPDSFRVTTTAQTLQLTGDKLLAKLTQEVKSGQRIRLSGTWASTDEGQDVVSLTEWSHPNGDAK